MWAYIKSLFPWMAEMGLEKIIKDLISDDASSDEIYATVKQTPQYQKMFPGMVDGNGQRRFGSEREYLDAVNDYRDVLREFGAFDEAADNPLNYLAYMDNSIDPNELQSRFKMYREIEAGSRELRDAFYVFAGMDVSVDDLYTAMVDPGFYTQLSSSYDQKVAGSSFDYETYITRATERGLQRVSESLQTMRRQGLVTGQAVSKLLNVDPNFAREVMGALFQSEVAGGEAMGLDELMMSFDYAMLASAATESGLEMPTRDRLSQLRQAGVDRARALRSYGQYAATQNALQGMSQRAQAGDFTAEMFEEAAMIGKGPASDTLNRIVGQEQALGRQGGSFATNVESGRVTQQFRR